MNLYSQGVQHGGFGCQSTRRLGLARSVSDADVICAMARHHSIAGYSVKLRAHHWPLIRRLVPAPLGLFFRKLHDLPQSQICVQLSALDEDTAPDDFARSSYALERPSSQGKVHRRLALAGCPDKTAGKMVGRGPA